jgi:hypothetical protein
MGKAIYKVDSIDMALEEVIYKDGVPLMKGLGTMLLKSNKSYSKIHTY